MTQANTSDLKSDEQKLAALQIHSLALEIGAGASISVDVCVPDCSQSNFPVFRGTGILGG